MSPSHSGHSSPALSDDDSISVFLRIPPDDPERLVRAPLVCKAWRSIFTGPDFCRLYREFHGTPPMLGFAVSFWSGGGNFVSRFIPTTAFPATSGPGSCPDNWKAVDSRHGRILMEPVDTNGNSNGSGTPSRAAIGEFHAIAPAGLAQCSVPRNTATTWAVMDRHSS